MEVFLMINKHIREIINLIKTSNGKYETVKTPLRHYSEAELIMLIKEVKAQCKNVNECYMSKENLVFFLNDYKGISFF